MPPLEPHVQLYLFFWHALAWSLMIAGLPLVTFPWGVVAYKIWHGIKEIDEEFSEEIWMRSFWASLALFFAAVLFLGLDYVTCDTFALPPGPFHLVFLLSFLSFVAWMMMYFYSVEDFFEGLSLTVLYLYIPTAVLLLVWWLIRWNPLLDYVYSWLMQPK
jgi:hypothetical protein